MKWFGKDAGQVGKPGCDVSCAATRYVQRILK